MNLLWCVLEKNNTIMVHLQRTYNRQFSNDFNVHIWDFSHSGFASSACDVLEWKQALVKEMDLNLSVGRLYRQRAVLK